MKKAPLAQLLVFAFLSELSSVFAQAPPDLPHPQKVHLCFGTSCQDLVASGQFYDVASDAQNVAWRYSILSWTADMAIMSGKRSTPTKDGGEVSSTCMGSMNPKGGSVDTGRGTMMIGKQNLTVVCTMVWDSAPAPPAQVPPVPTRIDQKPQTMTLHTDHVETLTWKGDHYDGVKEGQSAPFSRYTVERWDTDGVRFVGTFVNPQPNAPAFKAIFTGKISPQGGFIVDNNIQVFLNGKQMYNGKGYGLTWNPQPVQAASAVAPPAAAAPPVQPAPAAVAPVISAPVVPAPAPAQAKSLPPAQPKATQKITPPAKREAAQKTGDAGVPPKTMRLCINANPQCWELNWVSDHYEAVNNNPVFPSWRFWLNSWEDDHVEFTGKTQKSFPGSDFPLEGSFSGKVSAKGSSIFDGRFDWKVGYSQSGVYPITLTWDKTPSNVADVADVSVYKTERRSAEHSNITLPAGASESFAGLPADVRAALLPESDLSPSKAGMACNEAVAAGVSATDSLEIGKAAYRAGDLTRGHCWIKRAAGMGNIRARVLLGVAAMEGLGTPQDFKAAFDYFEPSDSDKDPWGTYFLVQCYAYGIGVPMDKQKSGQIEAYFELKGSGEEIHSLIGSDDIETVRRYERIQLLMNPPKALFCSSKAVCDKENQELYQQRLDEINAQH